MITKKLLAISVIAVLLWALPGARAAQAKKLFPEGTPTRAIQDLDTELSAYRVGATTDEDKAFNRRLKKQALRGTFDVRTLASLSMAKNWETITIIEQKHFVDVLSQLLERKAVFAKEQGSGKKGSQYGVTYRGHKSLGDNEAMVQTWVKIPSENLTIELNYKMHEVETSEISPRDPIMGLLLPLPPDTIMVTEWKIYDVIVDDASMLDNYRYQFDSIIRKGGYADLIRRMESKLKSIKDEEAPPATTDGAPA